MKQQLGEADMVGDAEEEGEEEEGEEEEEPDRIEAETYSIRGARIAPLRAALEKRGWSEEEDGDTAKFLWTIKAKIVDRLLDSGTAKKRMLLNHYSKAWSLITKHRLAENVRMLPTFEDVDVDTLVPPTYYVKDIGQLREFMSDFCLSAAQRVLIQAVRSPKGVVDDRRLGAAMAVVGRFLDRLTAASSGETQSLQQQTPTQGAAAMASYPLSTLSPTRSKLGAGLVVAAGSARAIAQAKRAAEAKRAAGAAPAPAISGGGGSNGTAGRSCEGSGASASTCSLAWLSRSAARRFVEPLIASEEEWQALMSTRKPTVTPTPPPPEHSTAHGRDDACMLLISPPASPPPTSLPLDDELRSTGCDGSSGGGSSSGDEDAAGTLKGDLGTPALNWMAASGASPCTSSPSSTPPTSPLSTPAATPLFRAATTPPPTTVAAAQGDGTPRRGDVASPMVPPMAPPTSQLGAASNRGALPLSGREQALTLLRQLATVMPVGADVAAALATAVAGEGEDATCGHLDGDSLGSVGSSCAWILKSVDMSRGRGITISDDLQTILKRCAAKDFRLIVQRYVERPLLVRQRKFDIRQWVLVTSVNPLVVWMYSNYYLRFSSKEYTTGDLADAEVHLTNQSVQKHSTEYGAAVESNMWSKQQFVAHLSDELGGADAGRAAARSIDEQMRRAVGVALRSTCDIIEHRRNSFELFGFDFLIDADHGVWLLEANSSPDMSTNAAPLRQIVHDGLDDLLTLVIGLKRKRTPVKQLAAERARRDVDVDGPCWRLAYRGAAMSERELQRRRIAKKAGADAPAGGSAVFQGLSHQSALRQWVERVGTAPAASA